VSVKNWRSLDKDNDYSLERMEEELLKPANLRFKRDAEGNIADVTSRITGVEGSLAIEVSEAEKYTPELLLRALDGAERAEKEFMRTGQRNLSINEKPSINNIDFERAVILANLLDGDSLKLLASRGLHNKPAGNRMAKVDAVSDLLYKATYGRDLYTDTPLLGVQQDQGHLESNSRGGVRLRPENALVNQWLGDTEGEARLQAIAQARIRMNAAKNFEPSMLDSPEIQRFLKFADFREMVDKQEDRKKTYGY